MKLMIIIIIIILGHIVRIGCKILRFILFCYTMAHKRTCYRALFELMKKKKDQVGYLAIGCYLSWHMKLNTYRLSR